MTNEPPDLPPKADNRLARYMANNVVTEFIGSVVVCGIVGLLVDRAFNTAPWIMLVMIMAGFVLGVINAWRGLKKSDAKDGNKD